MNQLTYCGIRDIDDFEAETIKKNNIRHYSVSETINYIKTCNKPLHISFDVDAMDPGLLDSTGTPVPGGLSAEEVRSIIIAGLNTDNLVSLDVVEFNTQLGDKEMSFQNLKDVFVPFTEERVSHRQYY